MSGNGAYPEEMSFSDPQIATFARAVQATLVREPDPATNDEIVRRLAGEARASYAAAAERARRGTAVPPALKGGVRRRLAVVVMAVAALPLVTAGLAVAGVKLPDAVDDAFTAVGVDLPNQAPDSAGQGDSDADRDQGSGNDGEAGASPAAEPGSDKAVKGGKRRGNGPPDHSNAGGNQNPGQSQGQGSSGKAKGKPAAPPGQSGNPPPQSNAGGNGKSNAGGNSGNAPGQANKPASPGGSGSGGSGSAGSNAGGQGQGQGQGKP